MADYFSQDQILKAKEALEGLSSHNCRQIEPGTSSVNSNRDMVSEFSCKALVKRTSILCVLRYNDLMEKH